MYLKRLELHGFKSFAKKTALVFEPGITSVVGPNGSGKSNVADSLRWVFGEQSMKLLRGKKSEDVIFAGSDHKARLGGAEVHVHFDNSDQKMPLDYAEVVIARRLYREGDSEYLINGNQVRLLDVQELLGKSGFGNTSYHVIGQGMIDQLILGGPGAVKDLLEEASGVKPYYIKRDRTMRRLERTENNLEQVYALVKEIEPRLRSLKRQTKKLEQRSELEESLREAQVFYYGQIFRGLESQIKETGTRLAVYHQQTSDLTAEIAALTKDIVAQEQLTLKRGESYKQLQSDLETVRQQKYKLQEDLALVRGKLKAEEEQKEKALPIDFWALKGKFETAYGAFLQLLQSFSREEAEKVREQFEEVSGMLKQAEELAQTRPTLRTLLSEEQRLSGDLEALLGKIVGLDRDLKKYTDEEESLKQQLFVKERLVRNKQETLIKSSEQKNLLAVEQAKILTRKESYLEEAKVNLGPKFLALVSQSSESTAVPLGLQEKISSLKKQLEMIGGVDELLTQEYKETDERYQYLVSQTKDLEKGVADLKTVIEELDGVIKKDFNEAFAKISEKFGEYFRILFNGGRATMTILREKPRPLVEDDTEESTPSSSPPYQGGEREGVEIVGIDIRATPPGKKLAGIAALSGGERALTSIALLCAILATYPSPFVVLDEVDAALDEANSIRFGKILGTLAHRTQFITITHNRETMRQSHTLYGVTMGEDGVSRVLSLKLSEAAAYSSKN